MAVQRARSTYTDNITRLAGTSHGGTSLPALPGAETLLATAAQSQRETMEFVVMRLEKDRETFEEARACRSFTDALALQSRWMQEMVRDYTAQTSKMLAVYTAAANERASAE